MQVYVISEDDGEKYWTLKSNVFSITSRGFHTPAQIQASHFCGCPCSWTRALAWVSSQLYKWRCGQVAGNSMITTRPNVVVHHFLMIGLLCLGSSGWIWWRVQHLLALCLTMTCTTQNWFQSVLQPMDTFVGTNVPLLRTVGQVSRCSAWKIR